MVSILSLSLPLSLFSHFFLSISLLISFLFRAGRQASTQDKHAGDRVCVTWGAVPSSVVALSAGWQGGRRPRRKRGPRGTRRRTPRWFHAVKAVRFLQQLRIAAPPTTDIHNRAIRHPCGGEVPARRPASRWWRQGGEGLSHSGVGTGHFSGKGIREKEGWRMGVSG